MSRKRQQALFVEEAERYHVFPLDNEGWQRLLQPRPSGSPGMTEEQMNKVAAMNARGRD